MPSSAEQGIISSQTPIATALGSDALRAAWSERVKREALFSARTTSKAYLDMLKKRLTDIITRETNPQQAEHSLQLCLEHLGYTPQAGFSGDEGRVPPAKPKSIQDLSSSPRIQLIIDTNVKKARSLGQMAAGDSPVFMRTNPAWRLERTGARKKPRGDWKKRWAAAGASVGWKNASQKQFVALKTSPIWDALGRGEGQFTDALGSPFPPFAFGSGMAWTNVGRREWMAICDAEGIDSGLADLDAQAKEKATSLATSTPSIAKSPLTTAQVARLQEIKANIGTEREREARALYAGLRAEAERRKDALRAYAKVALAIMDKVADYISQKRAIIANIYIPAMTKSKRLFADADDAAWIDVRVRLMKSLDEDLERTRNRVDGYRRDIDKFYRAPKMVDYNKFIDGYKREEALVRKDADSLAESARRGYDDFRSKLKNELARVEEKRKEEDAAKTDRAPAETTTMKDEARKQVAEATRLFMQTIGIKHKSDTPLSINGTNPKFHDDKAYRNNCQRCVPAYEARMRGYDVVVLSSAGDRKKGALNLASNSTAMWKNQNKVYLPAKTFRQEIEKKMAEWGDGARAEIRVKWKNSSWGHVFMAIQENGQTKFVDPQNPSADVASYFRKMSTRGRGSEPWILRVDNNEFTEEAKRCFVKQ